MSAAVKVTCLDKLPAKRAALVAIAMVLEGRSRLEAATPAGMDRQSLRDWVHRCNEAGSDGLVSGRAPDAVLVGLRRRVSASG